MTQCYLEAVAEVQLRDDAIEFKTGRDIDMRVGSIIMGHWDNLLLHWFRAFHSSYGLQLNLVLSHISSPKYDQVLQLLKHPEDWYKNRNVVNQQRIPDWKEAVIFLSNETGHEGRFEKEWHVNGRLKMLTLYTDAAGHIPIMNAQ